MSGSTKINVIANLAGRVCTSLLGFAFVPLYIQFMGMEAYGLIGFFASLQAVFVLLDAGLSTSINREMARLGTDAESRSGARTLLRTLEIVYWSIGIGIGATIALASEYIAVHWLQRQAMSTGQATAAIQLMALTIVLRWPVAIYLGALMGLRRHVPPNVVLVLGSLLQGGGAVLVLWLVSPTVTAFFAWQVVAGGVQTLAMAALTWRSLRLPGDKPRFQFAALRPLFAFSAGVMGITLLSITLTQADKFLLSRLLTLEQFGYYALAGAIAAVFMMAGGAVYGAIFPSLTRAVATADEDAVALLYHRSCQAVSLIVIPAGAATIFFAPELLSIYLGNPKIVQNTALLVQMLVLGNIVLALMMVPLALQLAHGWTKLSFYKNLIANAVLLPILYFAASRYGAVGAAAVWIALTIGYFLGEVQVMHMYLLRGEKWRWYLVDVARPVAISALILGALRLTVPPLGVLPFILFITAAAAVTFAACAIALPHARQALQAALEDLRLRFAKRS
jgi:O-antigen/teichoic acid export membrane protein